MFSRLAIIGSLVVGTAAVAGCGAPDAEFRQNMVFLKNQEFANLGDEKVSEAQLQNIADITASLFGTPDDPRIPRIPGDPEEEDNPVDIDQVLDERLVRMAAGKVTRDELANARGLYRQHCVHCHGITGDGRGPTAEFLNPYPRDFRQGKYKFKSTAAGQKPRHEDLHRIIMEGIPGTAMPSFKLLDSDEVEALIHYVKYLSIRGEVERELIVLLTSYAEPDELLFDPEAESHPYLPDIQMAVRRVGNQWGNADLVSEDDTIPNPDWHVPPRPEWETEEEVQAAWQRGKDLFYGVGNCHSCHGELALGNGTVNIYDEWTEELEPKEPEHLEAYLALGALPPRYLLPRNLRQGVFRGGRRPVDVYWRIRHGIEGSTMPAVPFKGESVREPGETFGSENGLTSDDIWCLVEYVYSLQYDEFSQVESGISFQRDRQ